MGRLGLTLILPRIDAIRFNFLPYFLKECPFLFLCPFELLCYTFHQVLFEKQSILYLFWRCHQRLTINARSGYYIFMVVGVECLSQIERLTHDGWECRSPILWYGCQNEYIRFRLAIFSCLVTTASKFYKMKVESLM